MKLSKELEAKRDRLADEYIPVYFEKTSAIGGIEELEIDYKAGFNAACELILGEVESDLDWIISCVEIPGKMDSKRM